MPNRLLKHYVSKTLILISHVLHNGFNKCNMGTKATNNVEQAAIQHPAIRP
jgi:hypothetical protein